MAFRQDRGAPFFQITIRLLNILLLSKVRLYPCVHLASANIADVCLLVQCETFRNGISSDWFSMIMIMNQHHCR